MWIALWAWDDSWNTAAPQLILPSLIAGTKKIQTALQPKRFPHHDAAEQPRMRPMSAADHFSPAPRLSTPHALLCLPHQLYCRSHHASPGWRDGSEISDDCQIYIVYWNSYAVFTTVKCLATQEGGSVLATVISCSTCPCTRRLSHQNRGICPRDIRRSTVVNLQ
jgi:hypothetical protein